jgi:hypothetical protein
MPFIKKIFYYMGKTVAKIRGALSYALLISMPVSVSPSAHQNFDYTLLDATTSQFVQQQTGEIRALMKLSFESIVQIGQKLKTVKEQLGHGYFRDWLKAEFKWGAWTATKFMQVAERFEGTNFSHLDIAPSALYDLAAPSTPQAAREEALNRAASGETITHTTAKAIKQKYATPSTKPKQQPEPEEVSQLPSPPTQTPLLEQSRSKPQIIAILPPKQPLVSTKTTNVLVPQSRSTLQGIQPALPVSAPDVPGDWWQLGRHLLYCGDPNSPQFLERVKQEVDLVQLLVAFPSSVDWQPAIRARARLIIDQFLPQGKKLDELDYFLESALLLYSRLNEIVVSCYIPSPEIISIINRQSRRGLFAEPDSRRVAAIISDWKGAGLKVERIS